MDFEVEPDEATWISEAVGMALNTVPRETPVSNWLLDLSQAFSMEQRNYAGASSNFINNATGESPQTQTHGAFAGQ